MTSVEDNILEVIQQKGRGSIFFPSDFTSYGTPKAIGKSLERLVTKIKSMVENLLPLISTTLIDSKVSTVLPSKTFLEKAFLFHELFSVEGHGIEAGRKSRHLYDLNRMMSEDFAIAAIKDDELWESIRHHREIFTSVSGIDYNTDICKHIVLIPRSEIIKAWEEDYNSMCSSMIFGEKPTFEKLITNMEELEKAFHNH